MKKIVKWTSIVIGGLIVLAFLAGIALYPIGIKKLTRSYPGIQVETANIPSGPDAVAHGSHVAVIWECTKCHADDLSGKLVASDLLLGTIPSSNLTSGMGGVGESYTDTDWIRAIRHGVKPDGRVEVMMYGYSAMSDQDLGDLIAYLKQIPPVDSDHPAMRLGPAIAIAPAIGLLTPAAELIYHGASRTADPLPDATVEYGRYLSATCSECHSSNLGGKLEEWSHSDFVRAMRNGILPNGNQIGSIMRAKAFTELNDMELAALWLYFQSMQP